MNKACKSPQGKAQHTIGGTQSPIYSWYSSGSVHQNQSEEGGKKPGDHILRTLDKRFYL